MKRDLQLDCIRGIACILMILAHGHGYGKTLDNPLTLAIYRIGLYAPVLFFASAGVSVVHQLKKRPIIAIAGINLLLFTVSFANMGLRYKDYVNFGDWNLYASLAISVIITVAFRKYINFFTVFLPVILLFLLNKTNAGVSLFYGGLFSVVPWTTFTLAGYFLHGRRQKLRVFTGITLLCFPAFLFSANFSFNDPYNSPIYLTVGILLYLFTLLFIPEIVKIRNLAVILAYLGSNSLLFYVIHRLLIIYLHYKIFAPLMWILLLVISMVLMFILKKINGMVFSRYAGNYFFWLLVCTAVFIPMVFPLSLRYQRVLMFTVLIIHSLNYRKFADLGVFKKYGKNGK